MCSLAHKKDELSPSSSASPLELYPNVHYLREEVQDINSLWWIRFALGSLSQKEKWQLQKESDAKRLALAGEMHRVWCTHPILSDGNSETQPVLTLHHHGIWWCVYISRSLPISSLLLPVEIYSHSVHGFGDACLTTTGQEGWMAIDSWLK